MIYDPIDETKRQVRLLHVAPGTADDELRCHFTVVSLDENPEYSALSYVWGNVGETFPIRVGDKPMPITRNLHSALRSVRLNDRERIIWADALSINQQDLHERGSQVKLMAALYRQALCVIIYLGDDWDGCETAMEALRQMSDDVHLDSAMEPGLNVGGLDIKSELLRANLIRFFSSPWFTRVWTAQESGLSTNAVLRYGNRSLENDLAIRSIKNMTQHLNMCCYHLAIQHCHIKDPKFNSTVAEVGNKVLSWVYFEHDPNVMFLFTLMMFQDRQSTDVRDKVYGLLGLGGDEVAECIQPDYTLTPEQVFLSVVQAEYEMHGRLRFLNFCYGDRNPALKLPTWVPDWSAKRRRLDLVSLRIQNQEIYNASKKRTPKAYVLSKTKTLELAGAVFDELETLSEIVDNERNFKMAVDDAWDIAKPQGAGPKPIWNPDSTAVAAFWLTTIGGLWYKGVKEFEISPRRQIHELDGLDFAAWESWLTFEPTKIKFTIEGRASMLLFQAVATDRRFCRTSKGNIGFVPAASQKGDVVVVIYGEHVPFVLRPTSKVEDGMKFYTLVGDAYIHGIMNGEALRAERDWIYIV